MQPILASEKSRGIGRIRSPRRVAWTFASCAILGFIVTPAWVIPRVEVIARAMLIGLVALVAFGLVERWTARLPSWLTRWALRAIGAELAIPFAALALYLALSLGDELPFWRSEGRMSGFIMLSVTGVALASWMETAALLRQREEAARNQARA